MKKIVLYMSVAILIGFAGGYLIFGGKSEKQAVEMHTHDDGMETAEVWTCSMHPQIRQSEPGKCPICGMDLIPAEGEGDAVGLNEIRMTKNAMALADIQTIVIGNEMGADDSVFTLSGKIKMNEEASAVQASYFDGRIEKLFVDFNGQEVKKGQLLASIYSPNLVAAQQELLTASSIRESQPALYKAVRNKLKLWKLTEDQINSIESSGKVREYFPIYASVSGTVSEKMVSEGDYVRQGQPIARVNNLSTVWADFDGYESQIGRFSKGQEVTVVSAAYPNKEVKADISFIDPVMDPQTRTVTIRATLNNRDGLFKPGMFVKGKVKGMLVNKEADILIPISAVLWTGERSLVYIKSDPVDPVFQMREIVLGNRMGDQYQVVSGLKGGEEVVVNGTFTIDAAAQLQGKKSMMNEGGQMSNSKHDHGSGNPSTMNAKNRSSLISTSEVRVVFNSYMAVKDDLVRSEYEEVVKSAEKFMSEISGLSERNKGTKAGEYFKNVYTHLNTMVRATNLNELRNEFIALSEQMTNIAKEIGQPGQSLYVQFCPMANKNQGATWLSWEDEIRNPYYGNAMLTCGEVLEVL